ncbi:hypothetical protein N0V82_010798 [Gnomoniopsis sp. IMI 355080]|nr:hypothetical protein N0V82_010798 [Gnomoniopsis sp. IMI 355080]
MGPVSTLVDTDLELELELDLDLHLPIQQRRLALVDVAAITADASPKNMDPPYESDRERQQEHIQVTGSRNTTDRDVTVTLDDVLAVRRHIHEIVLAKAGDHADVAAGGVVLVESNHRDIAQLTRLWDGFLERIIA